MAIGSEMNALASTTPIKTMPPLYDYFNNKLIQSSNENRLVKYKNILQKNNLYVPGYDLKKEGDNWWENYITDRIAANNNWAKEVTFSGDKDRIKKMNERRKLIKKQWVQLINKTRTIYKGQLTYAANYDNYHEVDFWEHLDFIGINAYFPLRSPTEKLPDADYLFNEFKNKWKNIFEKIGMENSYYGQLSQIVPRRTACYELINGEIVNAEYLSMTLPYAAGSLLSTVEDLY